MSMLPVLSFHKENGVIKACALNYCVIMFMRDYHNDYKAKFGSEFEMQKNEIPYHPIAFFDNCHIVPDITLHTDECTGHTDLLKSTRFIKLITY